jgi:hypothetical protein
MNTAQHLQLYEPPKFGEFGADRRPVTPNAWFGQRYPDQFDKYGSPFIELIEPIDKFSAQVHVVSLNHDFFAGLLGGRPDFGHHVIYLESELQWYFRDSDGIYKPTTEEKLANLYRGLMIRCAQAMPPNVHKLNLFHEFRSDKVAKIIVPRAKSILAADSTFFGPDSKHERIKGDEIHLRICRRLVQEMLEPAEGRILLLNDVYAVFKDLVKERQLEPMKRSQFKAAMMPLVRESFNLGLRNDLEVNEKQAAGWKNVRLVGLSQN